MEISAKDIERFLAFVNPNPEGCWIWIGGSVPTRKKGDAKRYGDFSMKGKSIRAHRFAYLAYKGEIEKGKQVDHVCRNTLCANPDHLRLATSRENTLSGLGPSAINARKTRCKKGHELSGYNLVTRPQGWRSCRQCLNVFHAKYRAKQRNARLVCIEALLGEK